jgi:hypothetical protein
MEDALSGSQTCVKRVEAPQMLIFWEVMYGQKHLGRITEQRDPVRCVSACICLQSIRGAAFALGHRNRVPRHHDWKIKNYLLN